MKKLSIIAITILLVIASCTKKAVPTTTTTSTTGPQPALDGAPIYAHNCAGCHGASGREGRAPNLAEGSYGKAQVIDAVSNGAGRMPAFAGKLSAKEIDAVATFVTQLGKGK